MPLYTATELLTAVRRRGRLNNTWSDQDLLDFANEELQTFIVPLLMQVREEYLVFTSDTILDGHTARIPVPPEAIGGKLRNILLACDGKNFTPLHRIEPERESWQFAVDASGTVTSYKFEGNDVLLLGGTPSGTLRLSYFRRPNTLVLPGVTAIIGAPPGSLPLDIPSPLASSVVGDGGFLTTPSTPPFAIGAHVDVVSAKPGFSVLTPAGGAYLAQDPVTLEYTLQDEYANAVPLTLAMVSGYLCKYGESPVVQCPPELQPLLTQRMVAKTWQAEGDAKWESAEATSNQMAQTLIKTLAPRSEGSARVIINRNAPGWAGGRRRGFKSSTGGGSGSGLDGEGLY